MASTRDKTGQRRKRIMVVDADPEIVQILEVNLTHANLEVISACNGTEALTKAAREQPDVIVLDAVLPDFDSIEICRRLKDLWQTAHIPVIVIGDDTESESHIVNGAEYYITKPFVPSEVVSLVEACFKRMEQDRNTNPLTGLPDRIEINKELSTLIEQKRTFTAIYIDINSLKAFNKAYGFSQGDCAIQLLAEILLEAVQLFGNPDDLVGHLGGDDFVIISTPGKARIICQKIIVDFDERIKALCISRDSESGYVDYKVSAGHSEKSPTVTLSVAVVTNEKRVFGHHLQVSEAASEIREYIRRFPGSNYYFDRGENGIEAQYTLTNKIMPFTQREELKILWAVLEKVALLNMETETAISVIKECLSSLESVHRGDLTTTCQDTLRVLEENVGQLIRVEEEFRDLTDGNRSSDEAIVEEVDLKKTFDSIAQHLHELTERRGINVILEESNGNSRLIADRRSLTKGLFYLLRSEVKAGTHGDRIRVRLSEPNDDFVTVEVMNDNHLSLTAERVKPLHDKPGSQPNNESQNDLRLAKVLFHCLGGELKVPGEKGEDGFVTVYIPKRWKSSLEQINHLQIDTEKNRQEVWDKIESIRRLLSAALGEIPSPVRESLESLTDRVQNLAVLCNRSFLLSDDLNCQMERQQELLLQQEVEQLATAGAMLTISREMVESLQLGHLFDLGSAQRTARNALRIAGEVGLSRSEQQALHCAALLKDLGLVLVPEGTLEQMTAPTLDKADNLRECFNIVWKALSGLKYMAPALSIIAHRYERFDGTGHPLGIRGANIPLGARILSVADAFEAMTSGWLHQVKVEPEEAIQKLIADAGQHFDPGVVSAFLKVWKRKEFQVDSIGSGLEAYES